MRVVCEELIADDLYQIMKFSEGSILRQYERAFRAYGIEISFEDEALRLMAEAAAKEKTGARGSAHRLGKTVSRLQILPGRLRSEPVARLGGTGARAEAGARSSHGGRAQTGRSRPGTECARVCGSISEASTDSKLSSTTLRIARLIERAHAERMTMPELCAHLFKDYQFGLSLIRKNTGQKAFVLGREAIDAPDKFLSELVVQSHYPLAPAEKN